jgi:hypothetical protein
MARYLATARRTVPLSFRFGRRRGKPLEGRTTSSRVQVPGQMAGLAGDQRGVPQLRAAESMECDGAVEVPHRRLLCHSHPTETGSRLDVAMMVIPHGPLRLLLPLLRRRMQQQELDNMRFIKGKLESGN